MFRYAFTKPNFKGVLRSARWFKENEVEEGYCPICGSCPMYSYGGERMHKMPGRSHALEECKRIERNKRAIDLSKLTPDYLFATLRSGGPSKGRKRKGTNRELNDPEEGKIVLDSRYTLAMVEKYHLYKLRSFEFSDGSTLAQIILSPETMPDIVEQYSLFSIGDRIVVAEPVSYSTEDKCIQYMMQYMVDGLCEMIRFNLTYPDTQSFERHIKRMFSEDKKRPLVLLFGKWTYLGTPNTPMSEDRVHCCTCCRLPEGGDPGCADPDVWCRGLFVSNLEHPGRHVRIIQE